ncbi:MAG: hypothetical protein AB7O65_07560, partial [Candidatus Korobacteraceae bacterium]
DAEIFLKQSIFFLTALGWDYFRVSSEPATDLEERKIAPIISAPPHLTKLLAELNQFCTKFPSVEFYSTKTQFRAAGPKRVFATFSCTRTGFRTRLRCGGYTPTGIEFRRLVKDPHTIAINLSAGSMLPEAFKKTVEAAYGFNK